MAESPTLCTTLILSVVCWILGLSVGKNQHLYTVCSTTLSNYSTKKASLKEVKITFRNSTTSCNTFWKLDSLSHRLAACRSHARTEFLTQDLEWDFGSTCSECNSKTTTYINVRTWRKWSTASICVRFVDPVSRALLFNASWCWLSMINHITRS